MWLTPIPMRYCVASIRAPTALRAATRSGASTSTRTEASSSRIRPTRPAPKTSRSTAMRASSNHRTSASRPMRRLGSRSLYRAACSISTG
jgi:hypothetical protein